MDKYNNNLEFDNKDNQQILDLIADIDAFSHKWNTVNANSNEYLTKLRNSFLIKSVGSSTRMSGSTLSDNEIHSLITNIDSAELNTRDKQEVLGYYDTLEIILDNYDSISLSENYIKQLHQFLLRYSDKDARHRGNYKCVCNKVVANYPDGQQKIICNTAEVHLVDSEMTTLVSWAEEQRSKQDTHPLIIISYFIYKFLSIHPFQDGNSRLSRLLTILLLLKNNYLFVQYASLDSLIEQTKKEYHNIVMYHYKGDANSNIVEWILYFLGNLSDLTKGL